MSHQLKVAMLETILPLHQRGWSQRRIARELGIDRETVTRYLHQQATQAKPAIAPIVVPTPTDNSTPAIVSTGSVHCWSSSKPADAPIGSAGVLRREFGLA